jgi:ADP-ribose pyrophosphatase YjhB (NUDIX family)
MSREYPPRPIVGIGVVVLRPGEVLLVRRGQAPNLGAWSLPGGGQELGETVEETARRELLEETALTVGPLLFVAHIDAIHRDPAGRVQYHYTILDFAARWDAGEPVAGGDITDVAWAGYESLAAYTLTRDARRVIEVGRRLLDL